MKNEVVMQACDRGFKSDVAIRCAGATIVTAGSILGTTEFELAGAITDRTAAIFAHHYDHAGKLSLSALVDTAKNYRVPVLIDAAFSVPPRRTFWAFTRDGGADAVFISGGKGLRGPQCTGLVLGKRWIVDACTFQGPPNDRIGRGMKVGKEELAGIYAAVKHFMETDEAVEHARQERQLDFIIESVSSLSAVFCRKMNSTKAVISFDLNAYDLTPKTACRQLLDLVPSVYLEPSPEGLIVSTECLEDGDETIVGKQLSVLFDRVAPSGR
jgi:L-seryl-tRNA(Ser) seleniumtransferase